VRRQRVASILARTRSLDASSSLVGTYTDVSSPARCSLARDRQSRLSVLSRLPLCQRLLRHKFAISDQKFSGRIRGLRISFSCQVNFALQKVKMVFFYF